MEVGTLSNKILTYLHRHRICSVRDVSMEFGITYLDAYMILVNMEERGLIKYVPGREPYWRPGS